jgi:MFS family permease
MADVARGDKSDVEPVQDDAIPPLQGAHRSYAMSLLIGLYVFNYLDRTVVNILAEPIKHDLQLADWQLGLMSGLAFALLYTTLGIPAARLAERHSRPLIIATSAVVWSIFTGLSGLAQNMAQLLGARVGVGVGEAGCTPPAQSLIMDYVPREKRASALASYSMGAPLGSLVGMMFAGIIADAYGWRTAFFVAGAPGLLLGLLAATSLPEPRRRLWRQGIKARGPSATLRETLRFLATKRTFRYVALAVSASAFVGSGIAPFIASSFLRNHLPELTRISAQLGGLLGYDLKPIGFMGLALGLCLGLAGVIGALVGGRMADRFGRRDKRAYVLFPAITSVLSMPPLVASALVGSVPLALAFLALYVLISSTWYGAGYTTAYSIVPAHMRATTSAILLFVMNLVGLGLGPLVVGALSDFLAGPGALGPAEGVRWAIVIASLGCLVATALFWRAASSVREDMIH